MNGDVPTELDLDCTGYDPTTEEFHARHEWDGEQSLAVSVAEAIAVARDVDPTTIDPLYEAADPKALERVLRSVRQSERSTRGGIRFTFDGHTITVRSDGTIRVSLPLEIRRSSE